MNIAIRKDFLYECKICGSCCKYHSGFGVQLFPDDVKSISKYLKCSKEDLRGILSYLFLSH